MTFLRRTRSGFLVAALVGTAALVIPAQEASAAPQVFNNACHNSIFSANWDQLGVTMSATSPTGPLAAGTPVALTGLGLDLSIPSGILVLGYDIGLLTTGVNVIPVTIHEVIDAANTVEKSKSTNNVNTTVTTTVTDPDGTPGTLDESATDGTGSATFADMIWTAGGSGPITFAEHNDPTVTSVAGGGLVAVAHFGGGVVNVGFRCTSGTVTGSNPGVPTFTNAPILSSTTIDPTDTVAPTVKATAPSAPFTLGTRTTLRWTASDTGIAGLGKFQAHYRKAAPSSGFGRFVAPTGWANLPATARSVTLTGLRLGYDYCLQVRGMDKAGNWSAWTAERCVARPLDDRALTVSKGWARKTGKAYWNGTVTNTSAVGATAKRANVRLDRVGIVATRGPGMGTVGVYVGTKLIGKISLAAASKHYRSLIVLPKFSLRTGTVTVKVLTRNKPVQLDGLAVSRS
jgi:hypothetical protein